MKRRGWSLSALALGVLGGAHAADVTWKASVPAPRPPATPKAPAHRPAASTVVDVVWRSAGSSPRSSTPNAGPWVASVPRVVESTNLDLSPPRIVEGTLPPVRPAPVPETVLLPVAFSEVVIPIPALPQAPTPASATPQSPVPSVAPEPPKTMPPRKVEIAPTPTPIAPAPSTIAPKISGTPQAVNPTPKPAAPAPMPPSAAPVVAPDESTAVWGGYNHSLKPYPDMSSPGGAAVPVRHGTYGSPSLRLSRDYHFLDAASKKNKLAAVSECNVGREDTAGDASTSFVDAEYLLWWTNRGAIPVLATTATNGGFGFLGDFRTATLLSNTFGPSQRNGLRLRAGSWLDECRDCGFDAGFFITGTVSESVTFNSSQYPTLARPFYLINFNTEFAELVAFPGQTTGSLTIAAESFLWGADINIRRGIGDHAELFAGYRYLNLQETLTIRESILTVATPGSMIPGLSIPDPAGTAIFVQDQFRAKNNFHGGQIGGRGQWLFGSVSLDARAAVALGVTCQSLSIDGFQAKTLPGQSTQFFTGGLLAVGPNLGNFSRQEFSVAPEVTLNLGYRFRPNLKAFVGYNFLAWSNVLRPGESIDRVVNITFVPNTQPVPPNSQPRPQPLFDSTTLIVNGIQFGLEGAW